MIRVKYVAILEIVETFDETKNGYLPVDEIRATVTGKDMPQALTDHIGNMFSDEADIKVTTTLADVTEVHNGRFVTDAVQSTKDCISRQAAIDALGEKPLVWDDLSDFDLGKAAQWSDDVDAIKELPSVQTQSTMGQANEVVQSTKDCISRQAAIAVADSSDYVGLSVDDVKKVTDEVVKGLKQLPSAQPEIIRCRDCKHYHYADSHIPQEQMCTCEIDGNIWSPDSYCSFAERKEDE